MKAIDGELFAQLETLPSLPFARLVRQDLASLKRSRTSFLTSGELPHFTYSKAGSFDVGSYLSAFADFRDHVTIANVPRDVRQLYLEKVDELMTRAKLIGAVQQGDDRLVTELSVQLFGQPLQSANDLAVEFETHLSKAHALHRHATKVDAGAFAEMARRLLAAYGMTDWRILLSKRSSVSIGRSLVRVPRHLNISRARAARLLTHEIEVHALRTMNGERSQLKLLGRGLANYTQTEEGLAMTFQNKLRTEDATDPGFWDAWAAALTQQRGFVDVFETLRVARRRLNEALDVDDPDEHAKDAAWRLCARAYRGITSPGAEGLGFIRDHVYRSGLVTIRAALRKNPNALPILFAGHAAVEHLPILESLGIAPGQTPQLLSRSVVKDVLRDLKHKTG